MNASFDCIEKHFYRRRYQTAGGEWSTLYYAIFTDWKKKRRAFPLGSDLKTARDELKVFQARNIRREDFDAQEIQGITFRAWGKSYLQRRLTQRSTLAEWNAKSDRLKRSILFRRSTSARMVE